METTILLMQRNPTARVSLAVLLTIMLAGIAWLPSHAGADEGEVDPAAADTVARPAESQDTTNTKAKNKDTAQQAEAKVKPVSPNEQAPAEDVSDTPDTPEKPEKPKTFEILGAKVEPGTTRQLSWMASESFSGLSVPTPVLVAHGTKPGPTLCLTAAVHGDELNGIEMVRRVLYGLKPDNLNGTVVGVPIVNLLGFRRNSRYLPDRRDLNRYFPGDKRGSTASRIAHSFFESVIRHCDALVDLHTGSFHRTNLPQLRADLNNAKVLKLTQGFGATAVMQNDGIKGTLRRAATDAGVPAVTLEAGEPKRFQPDEVAHGVKGIRTLLNKLGMVKHISLWGEPQPVYYEAHWIRAETGGILFSRVELGDRVDKDAILGTVTDPITNKRSKIRAPVAGRILGMALNQAVIPGFAAYHMGIEKSSEEVSEKAGSKEDQTQVEPETPTQEDAAKNAREPAPTKPDADKELERPD